MHKEGLSLQDLDKSRLIDILNSVADKYDIKISDLLDEDEISIPVSIFGPDLSPLELISKYLIENLKIGYKKTGKLLNRDTTTIYQAYRSAERKMPGAIRKSGGISIPISIISNRNLATLESIVMYLREKKGMKFTEIAISLKKSSKTIWTVYQRGKLK
jgi:hypothetical protein